MNGILIVDKPKGYTSRDVVNSIERLANTKKVGHGGTLDPIATGVLVVALGNGLKVLEYLSNDDKEYVATVKMGIETNTLDVTGTVTKKKEYFFFDAVKLDEVLKSFVGKYNQEVPLYSSVKVGGQRLYKYAREGLTVVLPKREVTIYNLDLISNTSDEFVIRTTVSKGTYIRSLIRDIGNKLGIPCTMKELKRTRQGNFTIDEAVSMEELESGNIKPIPIEKALKGIIFVPADEALEKKIMNGAILDNVYAETIVGFKNSKNEVIALYKVYEKDITKIKPLKVFKE